MYVHDIHVDISALSVIQGGVLIAGGNTHQSVLLNLGDLADNEQIIIGVRKGSRKQLDELVHLVSSGEVSLLLVSVSDVVDIKFYVPSAEV